MDAPTVEIIPGRVAEVGGVPVTRLLPTARHRTVGAWCFLDLLGGNGSGGADADGPGEAGTPDLEVGPHPHIGLQTVTWLFSGEILHRDSLGSEQVVRPGELNLMTAGHGIAHSEEARPGTGAVRSAQLWVAQPESTRHGAGRFDHHDDLPRLTADTAEITVLDGSFAGVTSPARADTELVGLQLVLTPGTAVLPLRADFEYALAVVDGSVDVTGPGGAVALRPGVLAHLGSGRDSVGLRTAGAATVLLLGGEPFESPVVMWWNYVARSREEITAAHTAWRSHDHRFATVASPLPRIDGPTATPWGTPRL
jgi:redox-sensitive bicupin YhaK (pirin superfamily)